MKSTTAATLLAGTTLAAAQGWGGSGGWGGPGGPPGGFANFPSCASSALSDARNGCSSFSYSCLCSDNTVSTLNSGLASSSCSSSDKDQVYQAIAQLCANVGTSLTASPEATWSATSGGTAFPSAWSTGTWSQGGGPWGAGGGWNPSDGAPFGGNGWGPWGSSGSWTAGPWTSWWNNGDCPASTWSGWTTGSWASDWTTWAGCTASTTATSTYTTTVSTSGSVQTVTTTGYGVQLAQKTSSSSSGHSSGAAPAFVASYGLAGSAVFAAGTFMAALLL